MLVGAIAAGFTVVFLRWPLALVGLGLAQEFKPAVDAVTSSAGVLGHLCRAELGGAVGVLFAPPRVTRRATAIAAALGALIALVAAAGVLGPVGGPPRSPTRRAAPSPAPCSSRA